MTGDSDGNIIKYQPVNCDVSVSLLVILSQSDNHNVGPTLTESLPHHRESSRVLQWSLSEVRPHGQPGLAEVQWRLVGRLQDELEVLLYPVQLRHQWRPETRHGGEAAAGAGKVRSPECRHQRGDPEDDQPEQGGRHDGGLGHRGPGGPHVLRHGLRGAGHRLHLQSSRLLLSALQHWLLCCQPEILRLHDCE